VVGLRVIKPNKSELEVCRICGKQAIGDDFNSWARPTFTNWDVLYPGDIICEDCAFWFQQKSTALQEKMGKDKPQKMQNYSHFVIDGEWIPLSKSDKSRMTELLLGDQFPELAAIADSGQKHIVFRAIRNPRRSKEGWVQFEEQAIFVEPEKLQLILDATIELYETFSKTEIQSGKYSSNRIMKFGLNRWQKLENRIKYLRGSKLFDLAIYLTQKRSEDGDDEGSSERIADDFVEGDTVRLQEPLSDVDLGSVRESDSQRSIHKQSEQVHQFDLFEDAGDSGDQQ